jgi:hypothetical protein
MQVVWLETKPFKDLSRVPADPVEFWSKVRDYTITGRNYSTIQKR